MSKASLLSTACSRSHRRCGGVDGASSKGCRSTVRGRLEVVGELMHQDNLDELRDGLSKVLERFTELTALSECAPACSSMAAAEAVDPLTAGHVASIWTIGVMQIEHAADHVSLFLKTLQEPVEIIATLTCVRSMLEAGSIAAWLLDPVINGKERLGRSLAHRFQGMVQQSKLARMTGKTNDVQEIAARTEELEQLALSLGFSPVVDSKGRRIGICQLMPSATEMIESTLGLGNEYRMLSAVAHGHWWAIHHFCYETTATTDIVAGVPMQGIQKVVKPPIIFASAAWAFRCLSMAVWNQCRYMVGESYTSKRPSRIALIRCN